MIPKSGPKDALDHAIRAADLYMAAISSERIPRERRRLQDKLEEVITLGEYLKLLVHGLPIPPVQAREITPREMVVLFRSSRLHGNTFLPWRTKHCSPDVFSLKPGQQVYMYVYPASDRSVLLLPTRLVMSRLML